jgi:hypothetical protein
MKHLTTMLSVLAISFGAVAMTGCGSKGGSCDQLAKQLCAGKDDATCQKVKTWLDSEMTGPNKEKLSASEAEAGCKMIADDKDALEAYKKQAAEHAK